MLQPTSRPLTGAGFGSDRSGLWTLEGVALIALGALALWARLAEVPRVDQFLGWVYVFVGVMRIGSGAVHRGPGLASMLSSAVLALAAGAVLLKHPIAGAYGLGAVLPLYLLAEGLSAFGLSGGAGVRLACRGWLALVAAADILLAALAVTAAGDGRPGVLIVVAAANLWLEGVTMLALGSRWEALGLTQSPATRPRRIAPRTSSRTYGRPWSRSWRRE